ncbi:MAG: phosphoribosyltransferase domain-containing protein, partial [Ruminococcus sp.]|nr:phosphoribosyltransferase domain-containing protein [Ruminococcus sp.]
MNNTYLNKLIKTARRYNNKKRSYLLVNTLQAKHIPVRPAKMTELSEELGNKIRNNYPNAHLVIGFAETATAIGVQTAVCLGENTIYGHTTRENSVNEKYCIRFREEHSHAVEQKLYVKDFTEYFDMTDEIILIDDEISTGKTLFNIIQAMRTEIPELENRKFVIGSIINRLTAEREEFFRNNNIFFESLYHTDWTDDMLEKDFNNLTAPFIIPDVTDSQNPLEIYRLNFKNARTFVTINNY